MSADDVMSELVGLIVTSLRAAAGWSVALGVMTKEQFVKWAGEEFDLAEAKAGGPVKVAVPEDFDPITDKSMVWMVNSLTRQPCIHGCNLFRRYDQEHDAYDFLWTCGSTSRLAAATFETPRL